MITQSECRDMELHVKNSLPVMMRIFLSLWYPLVWHDVAIRNGRVHYLSFRTSVCLQVEQERLVIKAVSYKNV